MLRDADQVSKELNWQISWVQPLTFVSCNNALKKEEHGSYLNEQEAHTVVKIFSRIREANQQLSIKTIIIVLRFDQEVTKECEFFESF